MQLAENTSTYLQISSNSKKYSKLNCEVLWDDLAFEVRWAVAGDSVVLQLVSKLEFNVAMCMTREEANLGLVAWNL
ncbi:Protein Skeletor [Blattella germanica]|nr:Protein Skeletor [Blattella germanica]